MSEAAAVPAEAAPAAVAAPAAEQAGNGSAPAPNGGEKRSLNGDTAAGEPPAKAAKVEGGEKDKKDKKDKKEKDKGEKKDKEKDKDNKDKKDKKDKKEKDKGGKDASKSAPAQLLKTASTQSLDSQALDHRKLFKEGQKNLTPPVADATRAFYESLLEENPDSKMAIKWCIEFGVLSLENHKKLLKKYNYYKDKGSFSMQSQIKKALDKKFMKSASKDKDKKDKKDKDKKEKKEGKEGKEKKDKDKTEAPADKPIVN